MIVDMESNKSPILTELFLKGAKFNILFVFISQSYSKMSITIRLYETYFFIMKIPNERELRQIASKDLSDIDFKDFMKPFKNFTKEPYSFLVNDVSLSSDN